ncbi:amidase [Pseudonocardia abyssalis]|uniref:Amidase n=1 Tax=Pseudonocardia abyssalis TaxID=2792008 RepID=A0ABS6UTX5_9PSEU|nr:amidase [Pseudonocardia abyssalis]MBW0116217.1 amidase [Pseudonocardia abyssalis]MBW0135696.1 amidase [Pseudonocardia abyssalis]
MTEPHEMTARDQAAALRRGDLGAVELVEHALRRVEALDPGLGAFVTVTADRALDQAREAEKLLATRAADLPPFLGVPTAIKDLAMTAGVPTGFGSPVYAGWVPDVDDDSARLLRAAGTISLGKTSTPEFGLPPYTEPAGRPPAVTPWDPTRLAGGSSGGAGAATAAGLIAFAHGTDGGGSIRIPAAACGLVGLKTSRGLVSRGPGGGDPLGMSVAGPLARTVDDAAAMLDALAVEVPGEPYPLLAPRPETYLAAALRAAPRRLRIGRYRTPPVPDAVLDPACVAAYEQVTELLAGLGHEVVEFDPGIDASFLPVFEILWAVLAHSHPVPPEAESLLAPLTRWWRDRGSAVSGPEYLAATSSALAVTRRVVGAQAAAGVDVVLTPMLAQLPRPVGWFTAGGDPAEDFARQSRFTPFTATYNITGQPALSLPVARARPVDGPADGPELPVSVQLVGRAGDDALLLELGAQLDAATGRDPARRPLLW